MGEVQGALGTAREERQGLERDALFRLILLHTARSAAHTGMAKGARVEAEGIALGQIGCAQLVEDDQDTRVGKVAPVAHLGDIRHASEAAASLK